MTENCSHLELAKDILESSTTALHVNEIAELATDIVPGIDQKDLIRWLSSALSSNVRRTDSIFVRMKNADGSENKNVYHLKWFKYDKYDKYDKSYSYPTSCFRYSKKNKSAPSCE